MAATQTRPTPITPDRHERLVTVFGALSDSTRMEMLEQIVQRGEVGCAEFDDYFPRAKSTLSHHAKILHAAGLIETRREGKFFFYRPLLDRLEADLPGLVERLRESQPRDEKSRAVSAGGGSVGHDSDTITTGRGDVMATTETVELLPLDTSDVDGWVGKPLGGANLKEPMTVNDIRRWAQAMQNPNPLYYDDDYAAAGRYGTIVAPQSFTVCCDCGHGATPAIQGRIEGSHMLFGGDEWWFYGPRILPGDKVRTERLCFDYRVTNTSFAGPTMFQRGDTTYINQRGEVIAKQRSTSIRYVVENAQRLASLKDLEAEPEWSDEQLDRIDHEKFEYYRSFQQHIVRGPGEVREGETLPVGVIGPHSLLTFTTEWRAYTMNLWGATEADLSQPSSSMEAGWLPEMSSDPEAGAVDPEKIDGLTHGPSRGHAQPRYAKVIGMPRAYGYGASMGSWVIDYVTNWAGETALLVHSGVQYRSPALVGDVTYLTGAVTKVAPDPLHPGAELVTVAVEMKTHNGATMARGPVTARLNPAA